jgi:dimethylamine monooxygenase subunit A
MGVRADDQAWPPAADPDVLALRRRILDDDPDCVQQLPGSEDLVLEVAPDGLATLAVEQPDDVCLLAPEPGWPLVAGAVLFPSHWHLRDKLGRPATEVHGRVPGYPSTQVDRFLDRLRPGKVMWRRNVLFHRNGSLYAPVPTAGDEWWVRSERQTLRRLPVTGGVLFTIHTDTAPVASLAVDDRRRLAAWLRDLPRSWADYAKVDVADLLSSVEP